MHSLSPRQPRPPPPVSSLSIVPSLRRDFHLRRRLKYFSFPFSHHLPLFPPFLFAYPIRRRITPTSRNLWRSQENYFRPAIARLPRVLIVMSARDPRIQFPHPESIGRGAVAAHPFLPFALSLSFPLNNRKCYMISHVPAVDPILSFFLQSPIFSSFNIFFCKEFSKMSLFFRL